MQNEMVSVKESTVIVMINEVEQGRKQIKLLQAENNVMNNFFALINRIGSKPGESMREDYFYRAKKEFEDACFKKLNASLVEEAK